MEKVIVAAQFSEQARSRARRIESIIKEATLYLGWTQVISSEKDDPNNGKYGHCWAVDMATSVAEICHLTRSKLESQHAITPDGDEIKPTILGYKETSYSGVTKVRAEPGSFESDFKGDCGAKIRSVFSGETWNGTVINDNGEGEGHLYIVEPFAFIAVKRKTYWRSKPIKMSVGKNEYQLMAVPAPEIQDNMYKILLHPERGFEFEAPEKSIAELIKDLKLTIPQEYKDTALKDSMWTLEPVKKGKK